MKKNELQIAAQLLDLNPAGALLLDARKTNLPVICVNQALADLAGFAVAEMLQRPWRHFSAGACAPLDEKVQQTLKVAQQTVPASRLLSRNHQGSHEGVRLEFTPVYDDKNKLSAWHGIVNEMPANSTVVASPALTFDEASVAQRKRAGRDSATGLLSNDSFTIALEREWQRSLRAQQELSAIVLRVDSFSEYLNVFGAHAGDSCLRKVASAISGSLRRSGDLCARLDDDSFVVLLGDTSPDNAAAVADRITQKVRGLAVHHPRSQLAKFVTVSCGVAGGLPEDGQSAGDLVEDARAEVVGAKPAMKSPLLGV